VHLHTYKPLEKESEKVLKVYCTPISKTLFFYENEGILFKVKSVLFSKNDQEFIGLAYKNIFQRKGYQTLIKMADTKFHALLKVDTLSLFSSATNEVEKYQLEIDNY
jgi:hypothetical protein